MSAAAGRGRVLVTGAAGFIGVPAARRLLDEGCAVVALDDFSVGTEGPLRTLAAERGLEILEVDLRRRDAVGKAVREAAPDAVLHLAALHFIPYCEAHPRETIEVNVIGTQNLLDALGASTCRRILFASTGDVYRPAVSPHREGDPLEPGNVYGASKLMGEWLVGLHARGQPGFEARVARLFNTYGPGETNPHVLPEILDQLKRGDTLHLGNTEPRRDFIFVEDVTAALAGLLLADGEVGTVNVGSGASHSVNELVERLARLTSRPLHVQTDPERVRASDRPQMQADPGRLRSLLPDLVDTPLDEGLAATLRAEGLLQAEATG